MQPVRKKPIMTSAAGLKHKEAGASFGQVVLAAAVFRRLDMDKSVYTIGHSTLTLEAFTELLVEQGIDILVDVRGYPGSRRYPHFNRENLQVTMPKAGIVYEHVPRLGGRRRKALDDAVSPNPYWENVAFRNYADYALGDEFHEGLAQLEEAATKATCAIMCAEAVWWRCHRRIITDYLLADGICVLHILGPGNVEPAEMTVAARPVGGGRLIYDLPSGGQADFFTPS